MSNMHILFRIWMCSWLAQMRSNCLKWLQRNVDGDNNSRGIYKESISTAVRAVVSEPLIRGVTGRLDWIALWSAWQTFDLLLLARVMDLRPTSAPRSLENLFWVPMNKFQWIFLFGLTSNFEHWYRPVSRCCLSASASCSVLIEPWFLLRNARCLPCGCPRRLHANCICG